MPLERFIPKSPDPFIRNSQDFEVAKFGHLNTIIEYVNTYVAADSLQLAGTGPLTSTARYITDSLGNTSTLAISTVNIGVGTTTPGAALEIYGGVDTLGISGPVNQAKSIQIARYNNSSFQSHYIGDDGGAFFGSGLTISASGSGSQLYLQVSAAGRNVNIGSAGQTLLPKDLGARLGVRGSGSTSATTSLLVQNSIGTNLLQVKDNGLLTSNVDNEGGAFSIDVDTNAQTTLKLKPFGNNFNAAYQATIYNYYGNLVIKSAAYGNITTELFGNGQYRITDNFAYNYLTIYGANVGGKSVFGRPVEIKGIGSTSATTSLLVQNSSGTASLTVNDAGNATIAKDIFVQNVQVGRGTATGIYNTAMGQYVLGGVVGSSTASYTTAIGQAAGAYVASGIHAIIIGAEAVSIAPSVNNSVIIGSQVFAGTTSSISNTLAIGTGTSATYWPTIYATNINTDSPNVRIGNNSAARAAVPTAPTASAIFELSSTTTGFLPPRMTTAQRTAIVSPAAGLIVYDTDTNKSYTYDGTAWQAHY